MLVQLMPRFTIWLVPSSGASGLAGLISSAQHRKTLGLDENSHVMLIMSEGPE